MQKRLEEGKQFQKSPYYTTINNRNDGRVEKNVRTPGVSSGTNGM